MRFDRGSRRLRLFAIALAAISLLAAGATAGLATAGVAGTADDPTVPETTTPAPTPDPAPAPEPAPVPKPSPKPKPAPRPVVHSTPQVTHSVPTPAATPSYTPPSTPSVAHTSTPTTVRPHAVTRAKPKRHKAKHVAPAAREQPRVSIKPRIGQTLAEKTTRLSPVAAVETTTSSRFTGLIAAMFAVAILLFAIGATPARFIPSGRVAYLLVTRRLEVTLFGVELLVIALLAIALTHS